MASKREKASSTAAAGTGPSALPPGGRLRTFLGRSAICVGILIASAEAHAGECTLETPECHLKNGQQLLDSDPKRAADELLASYKLDERTDTLALYAMALERDKRPAAALETWQRVIVFRESELDAAKEAARTARSNKRAAAKAALDKAKTAMEEAGEAIIKLWPNVGRVRVRMPAGQQITVTRGGIEVDTSKDILVNAGKDELVFTRKDGNVARLTVEVAAGASKQVDAPEPSAPVPQKTAKTDRPKPTEVKPTEKPTEKPAPTEKAEPEKPEPAEKMEKSDKAEMPLTTVRLTDEPRSRTMSRVGLVVAAVGVVGLGAAGSFGYLSGRDYDRSKDAGCVNGECPIGPAADLADRSNDRARWAQITAIGGGALLATGAVLWFYGRGKTHRSAAEVTLRVAPSSAALAWRF